MSKYLSSEELGNIQISEEVIIAIVSIAAAEIEGVVVPGGKQSAIDRKEVLARKGLGKNVKVDLTEGKVTIDLDITVEYGSPIAQIAVNVQTAVHEAVTSQTGLEVKNINVHVSGITFPKTKAAGK